MNIHQLTPDISEDTRRQLAAIVKAIQKRQPGTFMGDGNLVWTSGRTFLNTDHPAVDALKAAIAKEVSEVSGLAADDFEITGWAVIMCDENYLAKHNHEWHDYTKPDDPCSRNILAGVYYVQTTGGGPIVFEENGEKEEVEPKAGLMLIFDSMLSHFVRPHRKPERERISVGFNVRKAPKVEER